MIKIDTERAAEILVESIYQSDKLTAKRYGVSTKTIQRYRRQMDDDESLSLAVQKKREIVESQWADRLGSAILKAINYIERATQEMDASDPEALHTVTGSLKILAQIDITRTAINARYAIPNGQADSTAIEVRATSNQANPKIIDPERSNRMDYN